jgi:iron transport multicopper oxidase
MVTMIESPDTLQETLQISPSALDICKVQGIPTAGNCAGNTVDVLDTSGCNNSPPGEDWG